MKSKINIICKTNNCRFFSNANNEDISPETKKNTVSQSIKNVNHSNNSNSNNILTINNNSSTISSALNPYYINKNLLSHTHQIERKLNVIKKSSGVKKECLSDDDVINKNFGIKEEKTFSNKRVNYQMEKSNKRNNLKNVKNFHSTRTYRVGNRIDNDDNVLFD